MNSHSITVPANELKPRKLPVQARSEATLDALHTATIQVLTQEGLSRCTTTRVAVRAGMSVGSLYQYYPNRDALLAAVLKTHLNSVAASIERVCRENRERPVSEMASALVAAFLAAKLRNRDESKALYSVSGERGGPQLVAEVQARMGKAIAAMLSSANDAHFDDPVTTSAIVGSTLAGPVKALLDGHLPPRSETHIEKELVRLLTAYLQSYRLDP